jgi:hypothetical protein
MADHGTMAGTNDLPAPIVMTLGTFRTANTISITTDAASLANAGGCDNVRVTITNNAEAVEAKYWRAAD